MGTTLQFSGGAIAAFGLALLALLFLALGALPVSRIFRSGRRGRLLADEDRTVFLFEDDDLLDATPKARSLLRTGDGRLTERERVVAVLSPVFPGIAQWMLETDGRGRYHAQATGPLSGSAGSLTEAEVEYLNGRVRLTLTDTAPRSETHPLAVAAMEQELATLRLMCRETSELCWTEAPDGTIAWANTAYVALADEMVDRAADSAPSTANADGAPLPAWPPVALFTPFSAQVTAEGGAAQRDRSVVERRLCLGDATEDGARWFDIRSILDRNGTIHFARDAGTLVAAERQSKMFVQTLTQTFAHLSIGLAIFDKKQRLATFNPALLDLTGLPVEFLSVRPTLGIVLDRLREAGILQEPRNYRSWKQGVTDLVDAATRGTYCETWTLAAGQTYRVSGRPHPDGAIALLFEDISDEVSLTRAFRAQIETAQAVFDTMEEAIGVFSAAGTLTTCNAAFEHAWSPGLGAGSLDQVTLSQAVRHWRGSTVPTPFWDALRAAAVKGDGRAAGLTGEIRLTDGRTVSCRFDPLPGGAAMFRFSVPRLARSQASRLTLTAEHSQEHVAAAG